MKDTLQWIALAILALITPVQEYVVTCEALIFLNWIAHSYVKSQGKATKRKKKAVPVYVQMFFAMVAIVVARIIDEIYLKEYTLSHNLSLGLVFFELTTLYKNISKILGIDLTQYIKRKK